MSDLPSLGPSQPSTAGVIADAKAKLDKMTPQLSDATEDPSVIEDLAQRRVVDLLVNERARQLLSEHKASKLGKKSIREMMLTSDGLDEIEDPEPLVEGLFDLDSTARVTGKSNHGKSFLMADIACSVALGSEWHGKRTEQGPVVYVVAEGGRGFKKRIRAWEQRFNEGARIPNLYVLPYAVQIMNTAEWDELVEQCREVKPSLIVLDTQARITTGFNENDATDMGLVVEACERLRIETGACVTLVHHLGHNGDQGRGSTAVIGAINTEILVKQDGRSGIIDVSVTKQKDGSKGDSMKFRLVDQDTGYSLARGGLAGLPVTSAVLVPVDADTSNAPDRDAPDAWKKQVIPNVLRTYSGVGALYVPALAQYMMYHQGGDAANIGMTRAEAVKGIGLQSGNRTAHSAWSHLMSEFYIVPAPGNKSESEVGRHIWDSAR